MFGCDCCSANVPSGKPMIRVNDANGVSRAVCQSCDRYMKTFDVTFDDLQSSYQIDLMCEEIEHEKELERERELQHDAEMIHRAMARATQYDFGDDLLDF